MRDLAVVTSLWGSVLQVLCYAAFLTVFFVGTSFAEKSTLNAEDLPVVLSPKRKMFALLKIRHCVRDLQRVLQFLKELAGVPD